MGFTPKRPWIEKSWKGIKGTYVTKTYKEVVNKMCSYGLQVLTLRGNMLMTKKKSIADKILRKHKNLVNKWTGKEIINNQGFIFFDLTYESSTLHKTEDKGTFYINRMKKNKTREIKLNNLLKENPNSILIAHNPPYRYVDKAYTGKHVGSKILLNAIKKHKPKYVFCGHIHEARGKAKIGKTQVYNLGWHGDYAVIDTEKNKLLESNFLK
jgi:Icc-related predicted phosphoesterase